MYIRKKFFDYVRANVFGGKLTAKQVEGMENILSYEEQNPVEMRQFAYMLATTYWETAHTMQPVTEYGSQAYLRGKRYWPWIGRGLVQITWEDNYKKFGITNPEDALKWEKALHIMWKGMKEGIFTAKKLRDYFTDLVTKPRDARRIINGTDKQNEIAAIYTEFLNALIVSCEYNQRG